ncbi:MAG TPA: hypothetical protein PLP19_22285 [bacterium]|nr:hypothetical protein [bacterium]HPN46230.1 hypothetical protein [bacterium]
MKRSAPKQATWTISLILAIVGLLGALVVIPILSPLAFWLVFAAYFILFLGTSIKGF